MKKQANEPDFIGGQGSLTKEEEMALSKYFAAKKSRKTKLSARTAGKAKSKKKILA